MNKVDFTIQARRINSESGHTINDSVQALNELSHALSKALEAVETFEILKVAHLPDLKQSIDFYDTVSHFEIALIKHALQRTAGSQARAAKLLGLKPTTLNAKIKAYNLDWKRPEASEM